MIFTVGHKASYDRYLCEAGSHQKLGRREGYDGGSVWRSRDDARRHATNGFAIYGVLADWDRETEASRSGGTWHDLLVDAEIVAIES